LAYKVVWHEKALDDLERIGRSPAGKIVSRVKTYLVENPEGLGKPLRGVLKGLFRYRYGDFRVVFAIDREVGQIMILHIGHRKTVYGPEM
jgi:mRNA interferase RelE/StbE